MEQSDPKKLVSVANAIISLLDISDLSDVQKGEVITIVHDRISPHQDVIPDEYKENFWSYVDKSGECWKWMGPIFPNGYGRFQKGSLAHRVSYFIENGRIPVGICVLHKCDNRSCVNPRHLFLGTQQENVVDMSEKGRTNHDPRSNTSLPDESVLKIKDKWLAGFSATKIASEFGITSTTVYKYVSNLGPRQVEQKRTIQKLVSDETIADVRRLWKDGVSAVKIGRHLGISSATVYRYVGDLGPRQVIEPRPAAYRIVSDETISLVRKMWKDGVPAPKIASEVGISSATVYRYVSELGPRPQKVSP